MDPSQYPSLPFSRPFIPSDHPSVSVEALDLEQWSERIRAAYGQFSVDSVSEREFVGTFVPRDVGAVEMAWISGNLSEIDQVGSANTPYEDDILMVASFGGVTELCVDGNTVSFEDGSIVFVPTRPRRQLRFVGPFRHLSVRLPGCYVRDEVDYFSPRKAHVLDRSHSISQSLRNLLFLLTWPPEAPRCTQEVNAMVSASLELAGGALRIVTSRDDNLQHALTVRERCVLQSVLRLIKANCNDPDLSIDWLVTETAFSRRSLQRTFNRAGLLLSNAIQTARLRRAAEILRKYETDRLSMTAVAFDSGFNSLSYFCRAFRANYGLSPGEYRRKLR
ncbi:MAG: helix-turn-helix domain-containing protein [Gammaproteobacteria bacterium]|nr:helix-turn-helix domain-containing protein [Gammaproteobacteria bacterium]